MNSSAFRIRRATVDDLATLKTLWEAMRITEADLEKRFTEFQVAEGADGKVVGAVGFRVLQRHGLVHSEAFSDFGAAEQVRPLFWTRIGALALNHGVVRLWTRENSPFWTHNGLQPADADALTRLPEIWDRTAPDWLTLRLKDEDVIASLDKEFDMFVASEKAHNADVMSQAKTLKTIATVIGLLLALALVIGAVVVMLNYRVTPAGP